ncbi:hypothetical protein F5I97DRAFT_1813469 [Phlebopus sp. FC_14]|nr:hypothetical protein F5I97DRAFT_1813469 [Phlebopus sp. FC_14]
MGYGSGSDLASGPGLLSYEPTTLDILQVRHYFSLIPVALPKELVDIILDYASYWTHSSLTLVKTASIADGGYMYLRTLPLAFPNTEGNFIVSNQELHGSSARSGKLVMRNGLSGTHPCRRIEFQLWSHDQGWSSWPENQGTYRASWTWFDACIESPSPPSEGMAADWPAHLCIGFPESAFLQVQKNVHASALTRHHIVTWHYLDSVEKNSQDAQNAENRGQDWKSLDGSFVQRMQRGDCIALWMRARYPGWTCTIRKAKITVHWAV